MGWGRSLTLVQYPPKKTAVVVDETCPYQGLQPFGKEQARFFFGREKVVQLLMEKLEQANFVPIIGASGSGKSSVVRAGLIPQLDKNGWRVLEPILPGDEPLAELKTVLIELFGRTQGREVYSLVKTDGLRPVIERLSGSERLLLVVDQFEEVFTLCPKEEERRQFIELLTQVAEIPDSRLAIVTTMRADFLEPCLSYESLTQLIQNEAVYMPPLVGAELEEAIAFPANLQGYRFEEGLLGEILHDVGNEQGCLPLLQFGLTDLWEKRDQKKHQLTLEQYGAMDGVIGALDRHTEQIYSLQEGTNKQRDTGEKEWIKRIFLRLVRTGESVKDTRQRQPKAKLLAIAGENPQEREAIGEVLDELIRGRLLVTGQEDTQGEAWVDLAHEALMEGWRRFAQWRQENRQLRRLIDRVEDALREWHKEPKNENLMMGGLLAQVREKWLELESDLDGAAREFYQHSEAHEQDRIATLERLLTESRLREQAARVVNLLLAQPLNGLVLAIQSMGENLDKMPQKVLSRVQDSLHRAMEIARERNIFQGHEEAVTSVAFSPDGQIIVSGSDDKTVRLWDLQGNLIGQPFRHESCVTSVTFSPDGQMIVSGTDGKTVRLWDLQGHPIVQPIQGHISAVRSVAFSPDGQIIVSGSDDKTVRLWDLQGHPISQLFQGHQASVNSIAFSPDGQMIVSGSSDKTVRLWDLQGRDIGQPFQGHEDSINSVAFSPNGQSIVSVSNDRTVRLWDLQGNLIGQPFQGHEGSVTSVAFSPDGQSIVSSAIDQTVRLWGRQGNLIGQQLQRFEDFQNDPLIGKGQAWVMSVAFSPGGQSIVSGSTDKTVRLWDLQGNLFDQPFHAHENIVESVAFSPDDKYIVTSGDDGTVRLWNLQGKLIAQPFQGHKSPVKAVAFSPDGQLIVSGSSDDTLRLWDLQGNPIGQPFRGAEGGISSVAFSPDGQSIVSGCGDATVRLWDLQGNPIGQPFRGHKTTDEDFDFVSCVAFSPDGQCIVDACGDGTVRLWDLQGNIIGKPFQGHERCVRSVAFSPDGYLIVSGGDDGTVRLWNRQGNQIGEPFRGQRAFVSSVAFSPNGQCIVSGGRRDMNLRLWDLQGNPIGFPFEGHHSDVTSVAFSPDEQLIVSGSNDGTVRLWRGGWRAWLQVCCDRLRYHPVFKNPQTEVEKQACETCRKYVWDK